MSIKIDSDTCVGCEACAICPGNLITFNEDHKAYIKYPKDCWGCCSCIKECHFHAIGLYLGADIGGRGSCMHTEEQGDFFHWVIQEHTGEKTVIQINKKNSNKY